MCKVLYETHGPHPGDNRICPRARWLPARGDGVCEGEMEMGSLPQELGTFLGFKRSFDASLLPHSAPPCPRGAAALPRLRGLCSAREHFPSGTQLPPQELLMRIWLRGLREAHRPSCSVEKGCTLAATSIQTTNLLPADCWVSSCSGSWSHFSLQTPLASFKASKFLFLLHGTSSLCLEMPPMWPFPVVQGFLAMWQPVPVPPCKHV